MSMNDNGRAADGDFADPEKLRAYFEELDGDLVNTQGIAMDALDRCDALRAALLSLLTALDDRLPGIRTIVADDLSEAADGKRRTASLGGLPYDDETCAFLALEFDVRGRRR